MNKKFLIGLGAAVIVALVAWLLINGSDNGGVMPVQPPGDNTPNNATGTGNDQSSNTDAGETAPVLTSGEGNANIDADMQALDKEDLSGANDFGTFDSTTNQL